MAALSLPSAHDLETSEILCGLRSRNPYDQYFAVIAMEEMSRIDLLAHVVPLFRSRSMDVRVVAIRAVGLLGGKESGFYSALLAPLLEDLSANVRYETVAALGRLAHLGSSASLSRIADSDMNRQVRKRAAQSARLVCGQPVPGDEMEEPRRTLAFNPLRFAA